MSGFFSLDPFYKRVARGAFSLTLTCRTILPLSLWRWFFNVSTCIQAREHDSNLCNGHRQDVPSRRCCGEHRGSSRRDNRRQQVTVFRAKMRAVIRFNSRRNWFIARPWKGETTALLLFFVVHLSDRRVRSHHFTVSVKPFFFWRQENTKRKEFPAVWLTAQRMRGVLTPRTRAESNIAECVDASLPPPFFFYSTTPYWKSS